MNRVFTAVALAILCTALAAAPALAKGDTLTVGIMQTPKSLDPQAHLDGMSDSVIMHINEPLVTLDKGKIVPLLAESWKILDDKVSYEFKLKKGVKFHNGETMTADDVVYTFKRALSPAGVGAKGLSMYLADARKVDDNTVILKADHPMGEVFLNIFSHPWSCILSKKATEAAGADYGQHPVGTGKFKFKRWAIGDRLELERFDNYHGDKAKIKSLVFRTIIEAASRTIELESGAVDMILDLAPIDVNRIKDNPNLEVVTVPSSRHYHMGFDVTLPPYDNLKVRQAINLAINRAGIIKVVFRGFAEPARGPVSSTIKYSRYKETPDTPFELQKAKELLKEAGYPNGFKGKLLISDRTDYQGMATIIQSSLKEIGIDLSIEVYEWGTFLDVMRTPKHQPFLNNWGGNIATPDPFFCLNPMFHSENIGQTNRFYLKDAKVDKLLDQGILVAEGPERAAVYTQLWDYLNQQLPVVNILAPLNIYGKDKRLKGIDYSPTLINYLGNAYFE